MKATYNLTENTPQNRRELEKGHWYNVAYKNVIEGAKHTCGTYCDGRGFIFSGVYFPTIGLMPVFETNENGPHNVIVGWARCDLGAVE